METTHGPTTPDGSWLCGADGLYTSPDGIIWSRSGPFHFPVHHVERHDDGLAVATANGLWHAPKIGDRWRQLHDETLTEVLALLVSNTWGIVAGSPYGIATARVDELGAYRWHSHTEELPVNQRFTNALAAVPGTVDCWIAGTEWGVLLCEDGGRRVRPANLAGTAVRAFCATDGLLLAGTDDRGVWASEDGRSWEAFGTGADDAPVWSLAAAAGTILAGSARGVLAFDGKAWERVGPRIAVTAVAAAPDAAGAWLAGATPGGLWRSDNEGGRWYQVLRTQSVRTIVAPARKEAA
jgi:hypothetical protein